MILSTAWNPIPRRSPSSVIVMTSGSLERNLSIGRMEGGDCVVWGVDFALSVSGGTVSGMSAKITEVGEGGRWSCGSLGIK